MQARTRMTQVISNLPTPKSEGQTYLTTCHINETAI